MTNQDWLAAQFEANRKRLHAVAYRMLGSVAEADDVVQEAWLRLSRADADGVENLGGWLTTVVARLCLDQLRSRDTRREEPLDDASEIETTASEMPGPEHEALLSDSIGPALLVVLDTLAPAERLSFVLHDLFGVSFEEIAPIVGRNAMAARQLASRARRRVQGTTASGNPDLPRQRQIVDAFLAASRSGDFAALLAVLDPDVVLRADPVAVLNSSKPGAPKLAPEIRGAAQVAETFSGRAKAAQPALINGIAGAAWAPAGKPRVAFAFEIVGGRIVGIEIIADPARVAQTVIELTN